MKKINLEFKEVILIVVAAVLGGYMSLFIQALYEQSNSDLLKPELNIIFVVLLQAFTYIFLISIILSLAFLFFKFINLYYETTIDSVNILLSKITTKMKSKPKENEIGRDFNEIYEDHKELFKSLIFVALGVYLIYEASRVEQILGRVYYLPIIASLGVGIHRMILYLNQNTVKEYLKFLITKLKF